MEAKTKIFVTGADGMLGAHICRELLRQDYAVKALVLPGRKPAVLQGLALEMVYGDVLHPITLESYMADCRQLVHIAALTTVWSRRSPVVRAVNFEGTKNVMEIAQKYGYTRMVHIGSASSFAFGSREKPGNENNGWQGSSSMDYLLSKHAAQALLLRNFQETGFPVIIVNPTFMVGAYDSGPSSGKVLLELLKNRLPAYAPGGRNFVCAQDVAIAAVNALKIGEIGQCYIAGGENLSYAEFLHKSCQVIDQPFKLRAAPAALLKCFGLASSAVARIKGSPPKLSYSMAQIACKEQYYDARKAQQQLQMPQTDLKVGIAACVDWFKANGYV